MYSIIICYNCGRLVLAKKDQKTRQCPHCEARINTDRTKIVASTKTAHEASKLIRALKQRREASESPRL